MKSLLFAILALATVGQADEVPQLFGKTNARTFPYSMIGQLLFDNGPRSYLGSGTVIRPRSVLTAAHNLFDPATGWSTDVEFRRSNYGANDYLSRKFGRRLYVLGGYRTYSTYYGPESTLAFARDMGGIVFRNPVADGGYAGWVADLSLLLGSAYNILLGYGAETYSGEELLYVEPSQSFYHTLGAFLENDSIYIEGGMSGGPAFAQMDDGNLYVAGVVVSSSGDAQSGTATGGIRAINARGATFIRTYLP
jgi:V8-like Glu-specific endopeptidase